MRVIPPLIIIMVVWFLTTISYEVPNALPTPTTYPNKATPSPSYGFVEPVLEPAGTRFSPEDIRCLQKNIFFEAATESDRGRIAVGSVTLNRVADDKFPSTICGVVRHAQLNSRGLPKLHRCQFSWYCDGLSDSPDLTNAYTKRTWDEIGILAEKMARGYIKDTVNGSLFYHTASTTPPWNFNKLEVYETIGSHVFYMALE